MAAGMASDATARSGGCAREKQRGGSTGESERAVGAAWRREGGAGRRGEACRRTHASRPTGERWEMTGSGAGLGRPGGLASWAATGEAR